MNNKETMFAHLDPEVVGKLVSRREAMAKAGKLGLGLASAPLMLGVAASETFGQGAALPEQIVEVLNFALTLEELESQFYFTGLSSRNLIPRQVTRVFKNISKHEIEHVNLLRGVLGARAVRRPAFDFTAGGAFGDVFSNYQTFLALSQAFEDTGVRAYKGQAGNLMENDQILTTALQIHSVEARHAAMVRRLRGEKGWITGEGRGTLPPAAQPVYEGEDNTTQGGINLAGINGVQIAAVTEAFDEPLTRDETLAIARLFIRA